MSGDEDFDRELESLMNVEVSPEGGIIWTGVGDLSEPESIIMGYQYEVGISKVVAALADTPDEHKVEPIMCIQIIGICGSGHDHIQRVLLPINASRDLMDLMARALAHYNQNRDVFGEPT